MSAAAVVATPTSAPITLPAPILMPVPMQQQQLPFQAAEVEQRRQDAMQQLSEQMSAQQSRLEPPRLSALPYSILDLNAAMRNQAFRERALAEAAALEAKNLELQETAKGEEEHARQVAESALREAAEEAQRQAEEAQRQTEESQRQVEEARRRVEEEAKKSRQAAAEAMERPEEVELAALPDRIAEARFYQVDAEKIAEAERVYQERAVAAFHLENAQGRLLRAVAQGRADHGALLRPITVVRRVVPLPLPTLTVITTRTLPLLKEGKALSEEGSTDLEEDRSAAASDDISEA